MRTRHSSRLILLDDANRVLLFKIEDPTVFHVDGPRSPACWITPGGGLENEETYEECARRELWEEAGISDFELGEWIAYCEPRFIAAGELIQAHDRFFLARVHGGEVSLSNMYQLERDVYRDHRWWTVEELGAAEERIVPPGLGGLVAQIIAGNVPLEPIRLPE